MGTATRTTGQTGQTGQTSAGVDIATNATTVAPGHVRLAVAGELDLAAVTRLREAVQLTLPGLTGRLDLDLSAVSFLDATGLGALVWCHQQARAAGLRCRVVALSPAVRRLMQLTGTYDLLVGVPPASVPDRA